MRIDTKETFLIKRQNIMEEQATYNRKHKYDVLIGIDPDVERSGYSVLDTRKMKMEMSVCPFPLLVEGIKNFMSTARKR